MRASTPTLRDLEVSRDLAANWQKALKVLEVVLVAWPEAKRGLNLWRRQMLGLHSYLISFFTR